METVLSMWTKMEYTLQIEDGEIRAVPWTKKLGKGTKQAQHDMESPTRF
jgi:hypothetical protein